MATDEEYLDGLLKSLMDLDPQPGEGESAPQENRIEEAFPEVNDLEAEASAEAAEEETNVQTGQNVQQTVEEVQEAEVESPAKTDDDRTWEAGLNDLLSAAIADIDQITESDTGQITESDTGQITESDIEQITEPDMEQIAEPDIEPNIEPSIEPDTEQSTGQNADQDAEFDQNADVTHLIDGMADADEDLNEINDLFKQSDNGEGIKVDMSELLDSIKETKQEQKEGRDKKKKKFQFPWKKKGKKDQESVPDEEGLTDIGSIDFAGGTDLEGYGAENPTDPASRPKEVSLKDVTKEKGSKKDKKGGGQDKPGLFKRFLEFLLAEEEEEEEAKPAGKESDDDIFKQLEGGQKAAPAKKDQKKDKKDKKAKKDGKKEKKEKKPKEKKKKEPKPKVEKVKEKEKPSKPIGKMNLILVTLFSITIVAAVLLLTTALTNFAIRNDAKNAFESGDYEEAYQLLYGRKLDEEQEQIFKRVELVLQIERKLDNYNYYKDAGDDARALDALLQAADRYSEVRAADTYGAGEELLRLYQVILEHLNLDYGVSEEMAFEINACEENKDYSKRIYGIVNGTDSVDSSSEETQKPQEEVQDILPEEEDIIDEGV